MRCILASLAILSALILGPAVLAQAGDVKVTGNWKVMVIEDGQPKLLFLMRIIQGEKKITGELLPMMKTVPNGFIDDVQVDGDLVKIKIRLQNRVQLAFEGKLPAAGGKNINGSFHKFGGIFPAFLEPTTAKSRFEIDRDLVEKTPNDPRVAGAVLDLLEKAAAEKAPLADVKDWVDIALRSAQTHGPLWHDEMSIRLLDALTNNDYVDLAASLARKMEAGLNPKADLATRIRFLETMAVTFKKARKSDELKKVEAQIDKLEGPAYDEHHKSAFEVPIKKFKGRKSGSTRAVLVELFTGAQCPPCVAADLAFDALDKTYQPAEVVLLQYHLHIPGPDALANPVSEARFGYYKEAQGTPCILFNGKIEAPGGGGKDEAEDKYTEYRGVVESLLEKPTPVRITLTAERKANKIQIAANVRNMGKPSDNIRLRLALVEDWARYKGANGMIYHHRVVRAMPGGPKGVPLPKVFGETKVTIDLGELRTELLEYLDDFARKEEPFPTPARPVRLRQLHVVAFVQDDVSNEILQAVDVAVKDE